MRLRRLEATRDSVSVDLSQPLRDGFRWSDGLELWANRNLDSGGCSGKGLLASLRGMTPHLHGAGRLEWLRVCRAPSMVV